jgi:hypothetical protein
MSEFAPRSNPRLDNFETNKAAKEQEAFESALYADAGTEDFSDEAKKRVEEADAYERHMESLLNDTRSAHDRGLDRLESGEVAERIDPLTEEAYKANDEHDARIENARIDREEKLATDPTLRRMANLADQIAELRATASADERHAGRIKDKEDKLNELLIAYSEKDGADPVIIDQIVDRSVREASNPEASGDPIVNKLDTDDDELAKLTGSGDPIVNKLSDDELDSLKTDPVVNNLEDEKRDGEEGRLSKEDALNEAYAEYETREGEAYDVDKNRVKDIDEAREQAEAEDQEWTRQKAAEEEQIRTLGTIDEVRDEAYEENDRRNAEAARKKAEADEQDRTYGTADEVRDEAYEEDERLNKKLTWRDKLKNPGAYLGSVFAVRKGEALEKWRGSRKLTKVAIGVVALVAAAGAIKLGYDLFNDPNVDANNLPDGGGTPTPEAVDPTPTPEKVPTPSPEAFSDAARTVEGGEGWYQTFNEMDIPQSEWAGLLDKVGPDLAENGWAYKMPNGEWGISQPGKLPQDMLELIQRNR